MESESGSEGAPPRRLSMQQNMHALAQERQARFAVADAAREDGWKVIDLNDKGLRTSFEPPSRDEHTVSPTSSLGAATSIRRIFLSFFSYHLVDGMLENARNDSPEVRHSGRGLIAS